MKGFLPLVSAPPTRAVLLKLSLFKDWFSLFPVCQRPTRLVYTLWIRHLYFTQCQITVSISKCLFAFSVLISSLMETSLCTILTHASRALPGLNDQRWITGLFMFQLAGRRKSTEQHIQCFRANPKVTSFMCVPIPLARTQSRGHPSYKEAGQRSLLLYRKRKTQFSSRCHRTES